MKTPYTALNFVKIACNASVFLLILWLGLAIPQNTLAQTKPAFVTAKFSSGGMQVTFSSESQVVLLSLQISYCDGTTDRFYLKPYNQLVLPFTYFDDQPIRKIIAVTTNPNAVIDQMPQILTEFRRNCHIPATPPNLYCSNVTVAPRIYRGLAEPIQFQSTRFVYKAGLQFVGVDEIAWVQQVSWNHGLMREQTLKFSPKDKHWRGTFVSLYLPIGEYHNVWLIVQDEFGQQAKCKIGTVTIAP